jgi:hypothetical protein
MSEQNINFRDIDYQGLKESLIAFLQTTDAFKDANFDGTFLNHLVNMLSYTGAIFGNYVNSMANESYISTAQLYESANRLAKLVGYKAHGFEGSTTTISVTPDFSSMGIEEDLTDYYGWQAYFPKNIQFSTRRSNTRNKSLIFSNTTDSIITIKDPNTEDSSDPNAISLELLQGIPLTIDFVSDGTSLQSFEIPNPFIDWKNITVYVLNENSEEEKWESVTTWFYSGSNEKIYVPFINPKGLVEVLFADGNFGKIPEAGRTIRIEYFVTQGSAGKVSSGSINNLTDTVYFVNPDNPLDRIEGQFAITHASESSEGQNIEQMDKIKEFAPLYFGIQNRLVNAFDYKWYMLGAYSYLVDANAFNYEEAVDVGLLRSPCSNNFLNGRWASYTEQSAVGYDNPLKIPNDWSFGGFYEAYTVNANDTLPLPPVNGEDVSVSGLLNFGTSTALYVDTTRACDDNANSTISQQVTLTANETCCTIISFELEALNPNWNETRQQYPEVTSNDISLYVNGKECYLQIDAFEYNTEGYNVETCCCEREGDVRGWYIVKGVALLDEEYIDPTDYSASVLGSIVIKPNRQLLLGEAKIYPNVNLCANDVFIVPVPETGGYLNIETKENILEELDEIKMITVRNHIISPIYQTFDVRVVYQKDETSLLSIQDVTNAIRNEIINYFSPSNRKLGDRINTLDISNNLNDLNGVARARVVLEARSADLQERVNDLGDYILTDAEFPVLGKITL